MTSFYPEWSDWVMELNESFGVTSVHPEAALERRESLSTTAFHTKQFIWKSFRKTKSLYLIWKSISNYCFDSIPFCLLHYLPSLVPYIYNYLHIDEPLRWIKPPFIWPFSSIFVQTKATEFISVSIFFVIYPFHTGFKKVSIGTAAVPIAITPPSANFH